MLPWQSVNLFSFLGAYQMVALGVGVKACAGGGVA